MSKSKIIKVLDFLFWTAVTSGALYTIKASIDDLRDPIKKEKRKQRRNDACSVFNKAMDKACDVTKKAYRKIADWDEALDNAIPAYSPEYVEKRIALLKAKRDYLENKIKTLEEEEAQKQA